MSRIRKEADLATAAKTREAKAEAHVRVRRARAADMAKVIALDARITELPKPDYWTDVFRRYGKQRLNERFFLVAESRADKSNTQLLGFIIGIWAEGFEKLQIVPLLIITPLTFLGGTFYSIGVLPPLWQKIALLNPVVYLISGFRWSFFEVADVSHGISVGMTLLFLVACLATVWWMFRTGYKLKK